VCSCKLKSCHSAYTKVNDKTTLTCFSCSRCCPLHKQYFTWVLTRRSPLRQDSYKIPQIKRASAPTRLHESSPSSLGLGEDGITWIETPEGTIKSIPTAKTTQTSTTKVSAGAHPKQETLRKIAAALRKNNEMEDHLRKFAGRKFRSPKADEKLVHQLDRKYVGGLCKGMLLILMWLAEELLPTDPLGLICNLKVMTPALRNNELALVRPIRRFMRELKIMIRSQPPFSQERYILETAVVSLGNAAFSSLLEDSDSESDTSSSTTGGDHEASLISGCRHGSVREDLDLDGESESKDDTRADNSIRVSLFGASQRLRHHKFRQATANRNKMLLKAGLSIESLRRYRFNKHVLEKAVDFILSYAKIKGFSTTRLSLSKPHGSFTIPWLHRTMPREDLIDGYFNLHPDKCDRMKRTKFRELIDALTRDEVQQRTGIDYIAQEYGIDTFKAAAGLVREMDADGFFPSSACPDEESMAALEALAEIEKSRRFTMRWMRSHITCDPAGDSYFQHGSHWGLSADKGSSEGSSSIRDAGYARDITESGAPPTLHCAECTRFLYVLHTLQVYLDAAAVSSREKPDAVSRYKELINELKTAHMSYQAHLVRCKHAENHCEQMRQEAMKNSVIYVVADWKMKWIPTNWNETAKKWFGKRGIIWHGFAISVPKNVFEDSKAVSDILKTGQVDSIKPMDDGSYLIYCHDIFRNDHKVDGATTLSSVEGLVSQLESWFGSCTSWILQTDNGPCYKGNLFAHGLQRLNEVHSLKLRAFINTGVQDGKTYLDGHFGILTQGLISKMVLFKDMNSPFTLVNALVLLAPANCIIRIIDADREEVKRVSELAKSIKAHESVLNVESIRHFEYDETSNSWTGYLHGRIKSAQVGKAPIRPASWWTATDSKPVLNPTVTTHLGLDHVVGSIINRRKGTEKRDFKLASFETVHYRGSQATFDHGLQYATRRLLDGTYFALPMAVKATPVAEPFPTGLTFEIIYKQGWALAPPAGLSFRIEHKEICARLFLDDMKSGKRSQCNFATCQEAIQQAISNRLVSGPQPSDSKVQDLINNMVRSKDLLLKSINLETLLYSQDIVGLTKIATDEEIAIGRETMSEPESIRAAIFAKFNLAYPVDDGSFIHVWDLKAAVLRDLLMNVFHHVNPAEIKSTKVPALKKLIMKYVASDYESFIWTIAAKWQQALHVLKPDTVVEGELTDEADASFLNNTCLVKKLHDAIHSFHTRMQKQNDGGKSKFKHDKVGKKKKKKEEPRAPPGDSYSHECLEGDKKDEEKGVAGKGSNDTSPMDSILAEEMMPVGVDDYSQFRSTTQVGRRNKKVEEPRAPPGDSYSHDCLEGDKKDEKKGAARKGSNDTLPIDTEEMIPVGVDDFSRFVSTTHTSFSKKRKSAQISPSSAETNMPPKSKARVEKRLEDRVVRFHSSVGVLESEKLHQLCVRVATLRKGSKTKLGSIADREFSFNDFKASNSKKDKHGNSYLIIHSWEKSFSVLGHIVCAVFTDGFIYAATVTNHGAVDGTFEVRFFDGDTACIARSKMGSFWEFGSSVRALWVEFNGDFDFFSARVVSTDETETGFIMVYFEADGVAHRLPICDVRSG
jgi:hypothetical protein